MNTPKHVYIVGAGGVTSYFLPAFIKTIARSNNPPRIHIIDGDTLEERNLDRQLFSDRHVGKNKAEALVGMYRDRYRDMKGEPRYFTGGYRPVRESLIFCFVDNHPARKEVLGACDRFNCTAILAANEYTDAQAMYYDPGMREAIFDPRKRYPEILSDESNNPIHPEGCTGERAIQSTPQLPIANLTCASHALQLFWFYFRVINSLDRESKPYWPIEHSNNFSRMSTKMEKDYVDFARA